MDLYMHVWTSTLTAERPKVPECKGINDEPLQWISESLNHWFKPFWIKPQVKMVSLLSFMRGCMDQGINMHQLQLSTEPTTTRQQDWLLAAKLAAIVILDLLCQPWINESTVYVIMLHCDTVTLLQSGCYTLHYTLIQLLNQLLHAGWHKRSSCSDCAIILN